MARIKEGIYLEHKKGIIGTGHTAKETEYRNFWMTLGQKGDEVVCLLLDNDFKPTGIKQAIPAGAFETERLTYIPQGEKKYQILLRQVLEKEQAASAKTKAGPALPVVEKKPKGWWEAPEKDIKPGDIFKKDEKGSAGAPAKAGSGQWWEAGKRELTPEDIFGRSDENDPKNKPGKGKKNGAAKNWWDK
ncbi:MAG: hypothetical protein V1816_08175 [Pseudomonadota bacterium]